MNIFARIKAAFTRVPPDYVLLHMNDDDYRRKRVEWFCGVPYASPYLPETRCKLLPGGKLVGQCYVRDWEPASDAMQTYFHSGDKQ
jgi:hypothetical protein